MLHRLCRAAALSRWLLEAIAALALLSWSSNRLPAALALCAARLRHLPAILLHPVAAFLLGNLIVVTLFANSAGSAEKTPSARPQSASAADDAHEHRHCYDSYFSAAPPPHLHREEEEEVVVFEDKPVCVETTTAPVSATYDSAAAASPQKRGRDGLLLPRTRSYDVSVALARKGAERKPLRRSETDVGTRRNALEKWWPEEEEKEPEEEYDREEFRRRIEAFIAKQLRFIEKEEKSLLLAAKAASAGGAVLVTVGGPDLVRQ